MARTKVTATQRHRNEAARRAKAAGRKHLAGLGATGKTARFAYHSKGKDEITVREITTKSAELRISKKGSLYIRAYDRLREDRRTFSLDRIGWAA